MTPEERAREIASGYLWAMDVNSFDELTADIAAAIREAEREAYKRAAMVARDWKNPDDFDFSRQEETGMRVAQNGIAHAIRQLATASGSQTTGPADLPADQSR